MLRRRMKKNQRSYVLDEILAILDAHVAANKVGNFDFAIGQQKTGGAWEIKKAKQRGGEGRGMDAKDKGEHIGAPYGPEFYGVTG